MAIERGAGTEIIRCGLFEAVQGTSDALIIQGVQHHIYTILSVILCCQTLNTAGTDHVLGIVRGYDSYAGTTNQNVKLFHCVWVCDVFLM